MRSGELCHFLYGLPFGSGIFRTSLGEDTHTRNRFFCQREVHIGDGRTGSEMHICECLNYRRGGWQCNASKPGSMLTNDQSCMYALAHWITNRNCCVCCYFLFVLLLLQGVHFCREIMLPNGTMLVDEAIDIVCREPNRCGLLTVNGMKNSIELDTRID